MKTTAKQMFWYLALIVAVLALPGQGLAGTSAYSTVGAGGYDLVSYHTGEKPLRGNGNHVAVHDGVTYLFINEENREAFAAKPDRYLPMYGGYCAYGVAVGKKFVGDPDVWAVVDGRLYLNLDNKIQGLWSEDVPGHIAKANTNWPQIRDKSPSEL
jgi:YHS domain-containing protein